MWWQYLSYWQGNLMRLLLIKTGVRAPGSSKVLRPEALEDNRVKLMDFGVSSELHHLRMVVFVVFFFALF